MSAKSRRKGHHPPRGVWRLARPPRPEPPESGDETNRPTIPDQPPPQQEKR
jgi:hypothetical protein